MAEATATFHLGVESATSVLDIDLVSGETPIVGDFAGLIPAGSTARIVGDVNLTGDLIVEGLLTGIDTFTLTGNGFQLLVQNGGRLDLAGVEKTGWITTETPVGWTAGDRVAVAPMVPPALPYTTAMTRATLTTWPHTPATWTLPDGRIMTAEVANLERSIVFQNLRRVHFHDGAGVQTVKWLRVVNSGATGLSNYPFHFHVNGNDSRGSLLEGVVVEGGKNHAFVVHGSHGVTLTDCVAYETKGDAFWWDPIDTAGSVGGGLDSSNDIFYDRCLAIGVDATNANDGTGFRLSGGVRNKAIGCHSTAVRFGPQPTGFHWRHDSNPWEFRDCVGHHNHFGFSVWQNADTIHLVEDCIAYGNRGGGVDHGAYDNNYTYRNVEADKVFRLHAKTRKGAVPLTLDNVRADRLEILKHASGLTFPTVVTNCDFGDVRYWELDGHPATIEYRDCGLTPARFVLDSIRPASIIEIFEGGVLVHRWAAGVWS